MASLGLQILAVTLAVLGWIGNILICMLPLWKVTAFIGNNIVVAQIIWEGLWMSCVVQSTGQMQCKVYNSLLALPPDLQAARAMIVISILFSLFGLLLSVVGGKCTTCIEDEVGKAKVSISAGVFFLLSGALCLVTVSLPANNIIKDFYNPMIPDSQRRELGACLYVGWGAAGLLLIGGLFCAVSVHQEESATTVQSTLHQNPQHQEKSLSELKGANFTNRTNLSLIELSFAS